MWAAVILTLAGCANLEQNVPPAADISYQARENRLRALDGWEMRGRIAVDTGTEARQGRFTWWQDGSTLRVFIRGPLGAQSVEISGDADRLELRARRETRTLDDPETQLSAMLGWWLPISSLPDWLLGLPDARFPADFATLDGALLRDLAQRDWTVTYAGYEQRGAVAIPSGIRFTHPPLELVVTVDEWIAAPAANLETDATRRAQ